MEDVDQEVGWGRKISLFNGEEIRVVISMWTLAQIERKWGSISALDDIFGKGREGQIADSMGFIIGESVVPDAHGPWDEEALLRLLPGKELNHIISDLYEALIEGFQSRQETTNLTAEQLTEAIQSAVNESPGASSSTSGARTSTRRAPRSGKQPSPK